MENDAGYLTTETDPTVPAWAKAAQKPSYTAAEVGATTEQEVSGMIAEAIGQINSFDMAIVQTLPTQNISTHTIYLVPKTGETNDVYDEYVYINNAWEMVGNTQIDLSDYALKSELPDVPVQDVQINGVSVLSNGVANVPIANTPSVETDSGNLGLIKISKQYGFSTSSSGILRFQPASSPEIKEATGSKVIVPIRQHASTFYGLAKAAGDTTQSQSNNAIGQYTDEAKTAIQTMLNVPSKTDIPEVPVQDVQVAGVSVLSDGVANVPIATTANRLWGVAKVGNGLYADNSGWHTNRALDNAIKEGKGTYSPLTPSNQQVSTFYGLAKAAGSDEKNSTLPVGQYTDNAKEAIQSMLGITQMLAPTNPNLVATQAYSIGDVFAANGHLYKATAAIAQDEAIIPDTNCIETTMVDEGGKIKDVQVNGSTIVDNGVANVPIASANKPGTVIVGNAGGLYINPNTGVLMVAAAQSNEIRYGTQGFNYKPITPAVQRQSVFYGLAQAAGVDTSQDTLAIGQYTDSEKTAIKAMLGVQDGLKVVRLI